jgi:hypothetical protein
MSRVGEVFVGGRERQVIPDAQLREQGVDLSDADAATATCRAQRGSI